MEEFLVEESKNMQDNIEAVDNIEAKKVKERAKLIDAEEVKTEGVCL